MFVQTYLILCFACVCFSANYDIIWDQNYCDNKDSYPSSYLLPHNSPCSLCFDDVITLRIISPSSDHYENFYRVSSEEQMMNCNATVNDNTGVTSFKDMHQFVIQNAGSNPAFAFQFQAEPYYFISTSDGMQSSAQSDLVQFPNSCLQFSFRVFLSSSPACGMYDANCVFSSVFTDPISSLFCQNNTTNITQITTTTTIMSTTTPSNSTITTNTIIQPTTTTTATTIATTTPIVSGGLAIIFHISTTDSPAAIAALSLLLVFCVLLILTITPLGIIFLVLYWFGKIKLFDKKYFFHPKEEKEKRISHTSYKETVGRIELEQIGYPMPIEGNEPTYMNL